MLKVNNISFAYDSNEVLHDISFTAKKGEHIAIAGESGSGKSTLLKLLYGEFDLKKGSILWNNQPILGPKFNLITGPEYMKYVAQEFDLMPFTSVEKNIGEFLSNLYPIKKKKRITELLEVVELQEIGKTKVKFLSGGQKQRVALARALAREPEVLLLDEPFSHIDNLKKQSLRRSIFNYLKEQQITCIVATHDKEDIISYADSMIFLYQGKIISKGTPKKLYENPKNRLIASFFDEFSEFKVSEITTSNKFGVIIIYPHEIEIIEKSKLKATVKKSFFRGNYYLIQAQFNERTIFIKHLTELKMGLEIFFIIDPKIIKKRSLKK